MSNSTNCYIATNLNHALQALDGAAVQSAEDLEKVVRKNFSDLGHVVGDVMIAVPAVMHQASSDSLEWFSDTKEVTKKAGREVMDDVKKSAKGHPWTTVGLAAAAGGILAYMLSKKTK